MDCNRRKFIQGVSAAAGAIAMGGRAALFASGSRGQGGASDQGSKVALVRGNDRFDNMIKALEAIEPELRKRIGDRQIVIKPNLTRVKKEDWLASTHVDSVRALCEVFSSFYRQKIIIAEGTGPGTALHEALDNYGYLALKERYNVDFFDLQNDEYSSTFVLERDFRPLEIRISRLLTRDDVFVVSASVMKTHSLAVATLGLKNLVMAVPMNFGAGRNDRSQMHRDKVMDDPRPFNWNLFQLSRRVVPDLVTIDGFVGMQGDGPLSGDPIESKVALAGLDWLATDRVGVEVMGLDFSKIGHYVYCAKAGMGSADLNRIQVVGSTIGECRREFEPPPTYNQIILSA